MAKQKNDATKVELAAAKTLLGKTKILNVDIDALNSDKAYQRDIIANHENVFKKFDPLAFGVPLVGKRTDGTRWTVDGKQRIEKARQLGFKQVRVEEFESRGPEHEAQVFKVVNKHRTGLKPLQLFHAMLTAGDETAWAIKTAAEKHGFKIPKSNVTKSAGYSTDAMSNMLRCANTLWRIKLNGGDNSLDFVLSVVAKVWDGNPQRTVDSILLGLHYIFRAYRKNKKVIDTERLIARLNTVTPLKVLSSAQYGVGGMANNIADVFEKLYRKHGARKQ